jgi:hypothetical protein
MTFAAVHQEVIEISSESRRDVQGAAAGASCLDFRVPGGTRAGSKQVLPSQPAPLATLPVSIPACVHARESRFLTSVCPIPLAILHVSPLAYFPP